MTVRAQPRQTAMEEPKVLALKPKQFEMLKELSEAEDIFNSVMNSNSRAGASKGESQ